MKALLRVYFHDTASEGSAGYADLKLELPFAPHPDSALFHPVWHEPRKPVSVTWDTLAESFHVFMGIEEIAGQQVPDMYRDRGWAVTSM